MDIIVQNNSVSSSNLFLLNIFHLSDFNRCPWKVLMRLQFFIIKTKGIDTNFFPSIFVQVAFHFLWIVILEVSFVFRDIFYFFVPAISGFQFFFISRLRISNFLQGEKTFFEGWACFPDSYSRTEQSNHQGSLRW